MDWERLYQKLPELDASVFDTLEAEFCAALYLSTAPNNRPACVTAFLTIANWVATSMRSGVWTFYEATPPADLTATTCFLKEHGNDELASIFTSGIHEYQDPKFAGNYDYPEEWIVGADDIDQWISRHEAQIHCLEKKILLENQQLISSL